MRVICGRMGCDFDGGIHGSAGFRICGVMMGLYGAAEEM